FFSVQSSPSGFYPLSLHDALPISGLGAAGRCTQWGDAGLADLEDLLRLRDALEAPAAVRFPQQVLAAFAQFAGGAVRQRFGHGRSEEHTSELQSRENLVCRLLLEK